MFLTENDILVIGRAIVWTRLFPHRCPTSGGGAAPLSRVVASCDTPGCSGHLPGPPRGVPACPPYRRTHTENALLRYPHLASIASVASSPAYGASADLSPERTTSAGAWRAGRPSKAQSVANRDLIGHHRSTVTLANRSYALNGGHIVARGVHDALLLAGSVYACEFAIPPVHPRCDAGDRSLPWWFISAWSRALPVTSSALCEHVRAGWRTGQ